MEIQRKTSDITKFNVITTLLLLRICIINNTEICKRAQHYKTLETRKIN